MPEFLDNWIPKKKYLCETMYATLEDDYISVCVCVRVRIFLDPTSLYTITIFTIAVRLVQSASYFSIADN
jgi:hypothetical protein